MTASAQYEVEMKFPIPAADGLPARLAELGAVWSEPVRQRDQYFGHPARNFGETDEALRMRSVDDETILTYKGPVIDRLTKTRREIETHLAPDPSSAAALGDILQQLGFVRVRQVVKWRRTATINWRSRSVTCGWDEVPPVGAFLELEIVADEGDKSAAQRDLLDLAAHLKLPAQEPRSYLEMLLELDAAESR
ncbi:MAG: class IV adenylate cyclase [Planctomycetaceae bacterium]|nr:class IV adenylate cyclase [Planctomycetaceae bacterium]